MQWVFLGEDGLRVGWQMLGAIWIWSVLSLILTLALVAIPAVRAWTQTQNLRIMTPSLLIFGDGIAAAAAILCGLVIVRIEQRSFADYGLPFNRKSVERAAQGLAIGFAMVSALIGLIAAAGGFSLGARLLAGGDAARNGLAYLAGFVTLAFFEEFSFRGYLQATLASRTGFWVAAIVVSIFFGAIHLYNTGESIVGVLMTVCFGVLATFALQRTGSIWLGMGMHLSWDWGLTYFYSVPDSGIPATGRLFSASLHGARWLTGGMVGPEGSAFAFIVLILTAIVIHFAFPAGRNVT